MLSSRNFWIGIFDLFVAIPFAAVVHFTTFTTVWFILLLAAGVANLYVAFMHTK